MTKESLINDIALTFGLSKAKTLVVVDFIFGQLGKSVRESGRVSVAKFGTFRLVTRKSRAVMNPQTRARMVLPESKTVAFRAARELKAGL